MPAVLPVLDAAAVRQALRSRSEIALLDVREEALHAESHPLFAANMPLSRLELDAWSRPPRSDVPIVVMDSGEGLAERAVARLTALGYTKVHLLEGGLIGWAASGGELFSDVNVPSKAFGELVEAVRHTPSLPADAVKRLIDEGADVAIVDARRFDEYRTMSIPSATSVPGGELALRIRDIAPDPDTQVIVNCAGRTRSIIGAQSLINAGIPNRVFALRNGTIGWTLAGYALSSGATARHGEVSENHRELAARAARALADRAGVERLSWEALRDLEADTMRTLYRFDVRTPEEFALAHAAGFISAPGGQLVQETEMFAPVRGARVVLADDDGVRASMTGHWLAQMGWQVFVLPPLGPAELSEQGAPISLAPHAPAVPGVSVAEAQRLLASGTALALDVGPSARYVKRHVDGAWFILRARLADDLHRLPIAQHYIVTADEVELAAWAAADLRALVDATVHVLAGGNVAWFAAGGAEGAGDARLASPRIDRYRRPYEGTDNPASAMQAYLDWEYGLVAQLERDATHGFRVI
ncbi:rhodanese-like domain-containing protein [Niveibacterium sp.]|uniref:rhodanese-like domain-containing protein n=1 Tax=Niveibacterium sp. TaxID=2017444 RepID=UPI0035AEA3CC